MPRFYFLLAPLLLTGCFHTTAVVGIGNHAKVSAAKSELTSFRRIFVRFHLDCDRYPTQAEGLMALGHAPSALTGKWSGPYIGRPVLTDPWGNPYVYRSSGPNAFALTSYGADGVPGGTGESADLVVTS